MPTRPRLTCTTLEGGQLGRLSPGQFRERGGREREREGERERERERERGSKAGEREKVEDWMVVRFFQFFLSVLCTQRAYMSMLWA